MRSTICENQNQLRKQVRAAWNEPFSIENAIIVKTSDRFEVASSLRMFANELGARFIVLDLEGHLSEEQSELLGRRGPRIVLLSGLDTLGTDDLQELPAAINAGGKALPVIVWLQEPANDEASSSPNTAAAA